MAAESEAKGAINDGRKRKRRFLPHNRPVKKKGPSPLRPGVVGFFITCDGGRETQASHEALDVIDSFFEDLIDGKGSSNTGAATIPKKPMNKKIKFSYSESSESEGGDDNGDESDEEEKNLEKPVKEDEDKASEETPNGKSSDEMKKDDQPQEVLSEQTNQKEVDKQQVDGESEVINDPPAKKQCGDAQKLETGNNGLDKTEKSVDQLIEAELRELTNKGKRRFARLDTGCNGVVFILMRKREGDPGPREIVQHMMEQAAKTKKHMSRFLLRVLPVEVSCYASPEEISKAMKPLTDQYFPVDSKTPVKFAVQYDARANSGIERMKIIDAVAKAVPEPHKVDLKNPEKTIIVQIIKTVCLIGVVERYKELGKYNVRQLTS